MKSYLIVFKGGMHPERGTAAFEDLKTRQLAWLKSLHDSGHLVATGPSHAGKSKRFELDNGSVISTDASDPPDSVGRGFTVIAAESEAEAEAMARRTPLYEFGTRAEMREVFLHQFS